MVVSAAALTASAQAAPGAEFEAATVKPSAPNSQMASPAIRQLLANMLDMAPGAIPSNPGRVNIRNETLAQIAARAWSVRASRVSGPKWISEDLFDIDATFPRETTREDLHLMLQELLEDRFGLKLHREQISVKGYALVVAKDGPKLTPAAPIRPLSVEAGPPPIPKPPSSPLPPGFQRSSYPRVTTDTLAAILSRMVESTVVDMTGLTGNYDIVLETSRDTPESAGATVFDAVRALGLRLESRTVPIEMLVIDQVSRTPAPN